MFADFLAILQQVKADKKGVTALEYGVIAAIIVVALTLAVPPLAAALTATFALIAAAMKPPRCRGRSRGRGSGPPCSRP